MLIEFRANFPAMKAARLRLRSLCEYPLKSVVAIPPTEWVSRQSTQKSHSVLVASMPSQPGAIYNSCPVAEASQVDCELKLPRSRLLVTYLDRDLEVLGL
jgi:hypothetical protein